MTDIDKVYMLDINTKLDHSVLRSIYSQGFSRIPVFERSRNNIVGILMTRDLILINPDKALITLKQLSSILIRDVVAVDSNDKLEPLLGYFKKGLTHIGIVTETEILEDGRDPTRKIIGVVTLEDIIESIISDKIQDEYEQTEERNKREMMKKKLVLLFNDNEAQSTLNENEIQAILEYM